MYKESEPPIYRRIIEDVKRQIDDGEYQVGDLLPSENDMCQSYHTTRPTVRQALFELIRSGYINRFQGKGSIVIEPKKGLGILSINGVTAGTKGKNLSTYILEKPVKADWPAQFYYDLSHQEKEAGCIFFSRIRVINQLPVLYEETHITNDHLPRFTARNLENKSLFKTLKNYYQVEITGGEQMIFAINANKKLSRLLKIKLNSPVVHFKRKLHTNIKNLNIYSALYCHTEEYFIQDYF